MKIVRFSVNVGKYDTRENFDFCVKTEYNLFRNNALNSRIYKILAHKYFDCDVSIYYDANQKVGDVSDEEMAACLGDGDICVAKSELKCCVFREINDSLRRVREKSGKYL